jgi:hypothetical protein
MHPAISHPRRSQFRNLTHRRRARPESWRWGCPVVICFASRMRPSGRIRIDAPQPVPFLPYRDRRSGAAFRSPVTKTRFRAPIPRSALLACPLLIASDLHRIRSGPLPRDASPASTPLWGFLCPAGSRRSACASSPEVHLRRLPDLPSLPMARLHFLNDDGQGSTFQVRCFLRGSLFPCYRWTTSFDT